MPFPARPAQTRVKHDILSQYVGAWMGIISGGLISRAQRWGATSTFDFAYLDGFAGCGAYIGDESDPPDAPDRLVWGSPIIGALAMATGGAIQRAKGLDVRMTAVFVEQKQQYYDELLRALAQAGVENVTASTGLTREPLGYNYAIHGDFRDHVRSVLNLLHDRVYLLAFVDPYGPSARLDALSWLLQRKGTDLIVLFPSQRVLIDGGSAAKPAHSRADGDLQNIDRVDALFGTDSWQQIAQVPNLPPADRIGRYTSLYREQLRGASRRSFWIKHIPLRFSASPAEFDGYSLFLLTEDADGAMKMNSILRAADYRKHWERWADLKERDRKRREATEGFELLLEVRDPGPGVDPPYEPSDEDVDEAVLGVLPLIGDSIEWKELLGQLADSVFTAGEIKRCLTRFHNKGWIDRPSKLRSGSRITRLL